MYVNLHPISPSAVKVGDKGTIWWGGCGQGGTVTAIHPNGTFEITGPVGNVVVVEQPDRFMPAAYEAELERLQSQGWDDFENGNERRHDFPCDEAANAYRIGWSEAVRYGNRMSDSIARYADSDVAPDWFDPSYAGERWSDD